MVTPDGTTLIALGFDKGISTFAGFDGAIDIASKEFLTNKFPDEPQEVLNDFRLWALFKELTAIGMLNELAHEIAQGVLDARLPHMVEVFKEGVTGPGLNGSTVVESVGISVNALFGLRGRTMATVDVGSYLPGLQMIDRFNPNLRGFISRNFVGGDETAANKCLDIAANFPDVTSATSFNGIVNSYLMANPDMIRIGHDGDITKPI